MIREWVALHDFMKSIGVNWKELTDLKKYERDLKQTEAFKDFLAKDEREYVLIKGEYYPNNLPFHDYA